MPEEEEGQPYNGEAGYCSAKLVDYPCRFPAGHAVDHEFVTRAGVVRRPREGVPEPGRDHQVAQVAAALGRLALAFERIAAAQELLAKCSLDTLEFERGKHEINSALERERQEFFAKSVAQQAEYVETQRDAAVTNRQLASAQQVIAEAVKGESAPEPWQQPQQDDEDDES